MHGSRATVRSDGVSESSRCQHEASIQDAGVPNELPSRHPVPGFYEPSRRDEEGFVYQDRGLRQPL